MPGRTEEENATNPDSCAEEIARCRSEAFLPGQALLKFHNVACLLTLYQGFKSPPPAPFFKAGGRLFQNIMLSKYFLQRSKF